MPELTSKHSQSSKTGRAVVAHAPMAASVCSLPKPKRVSSAWVVATFLRNFRSERSSSLGNSSGSLVG